MAKLTGQQYRDHAHRVAKRHTIILNDVPELDASPDEAGACACATPHVDVATIVDEQTYAVALHEIGHIVIKDRFRKRFSSLRNHPNAYRAYRRLALKEEHAAWKWACAHVKGDWTPAMEAVKVWGLNTYKEHPARVPWPFACPPPFPQMVMLPKIINAGILLDVLEVALRLLEVPPGRKERS